MENELTTHLLELLEGKFAHINLEKVLSEFPVEWRNEKAENAPHTAWELLEHIRIAQFDILEFSRDENHISPAFPEGYWNKKDASAEDWQNSVRKILNDLQAMRELVANSETELSAKIPHGTGQTILREALLLADHNAYHLGQIVQLQRILENNTNKWEIKREKI